MRGGGREIDSSQAGEENFRQTLFMRGCCSGAGGGHALNILREGKGLRRKHVHSRPAVSQPISASSRGDWDEVGSRPCRCCRLSLRAVRRKGSPFGAGVGCVRQVKRED